MNVLITGPARGIGATVARMLAAKGARVSLVGLEPERLSALAAELGPRHLWVECDVTDQAALTRAVEETVHVLGGIDVVVANAGIASHGTVAVTPADAMARVIEVNLTGVIRTVSATLPHVVASKGYFLLVSSAAALATTPGLAAYGASKSGVEHFGNALRIELAAKGVQVGIAHPGWIDTDLVRDASRDMEGFLRRIKSMPGPFSTITPLEECAAALVRAIEKRSRKVFVPKSLATFSALRPLFMGPLGEFFLRRDARRQLPEMEQELRAHERSFGENSVESLKR